MNGRVKIKEQNRTFMPLNSLPPGALIDYVRKGCLHLSQIAAFAGVISFPTAN